MNKQKTPNNLGNTLPREKFPPLYSCLVACVKLKWDAFVEQPLSSRGRCHTLLGKRARLLPAWVVHFHGKQKLIKFMSFIHKRITGFHLTARNKLGLWCSADTNWSHWFKRGVLASSSYMNTVVFTPLSGICQMTMEKKQLQIFKISICFGHWGFLPTDLKSVFKGPKCLWNIYKDVLANGFNSYPEGCVHPSHIRIYFVFSCQCFNKGT